MLTGEEYRDKWSTKTKVGAKIWKPPKKFAKTTNGKSNLCRESSIGSIAWILGYRWMILYTVSEIGWIPGMDAHGKQPELVESCPLNFGEPRFFWRSTVRFVRLIVCSGTRTVFGPIDRHSPEIKKVADIWLWLTSSAGFPWGWSTNYCTLTFDMVRSSTAPETTSYGECTLFEFWDESKLKNA